jgi:hypothetical protein
VISAQGGIEDLAGTRMADRGIDEICLKRTVAGLANFGAALERWIDEICWKIILGFEIDTN